MIARTAGELSVAATGTGTPVALLHSSGLSGRQWRRLVPRLVDAGYRAIVPDLTGHGASAAWPEPTPFSLHTDVESLTGLVREHGPLHIVGHSYGGLLALFVALAAPESVRSLVLYEPVAFGSLDPVGDARARASLPDLDPLWGASHGAQERWLSAFVDYWNGAGAWSALREDARAEFRRVGWVVREGVRTLIADRTPASAYAPIKCPVVLVSGAGSPIAARRTVERLGASIPNALVVVIPDVGHMAPVTHADRVNDVILSALAKAP
jgi:pimeloyl-ACP methyl ester carboxylesterase